MNANHDLIQAVRSNCVYAMREAIAAGADVHSPGPGGKCLLDIAQKASALDAARCLLQHGCRADVVLPTHETLLHRAARQGDMGFSALLLEFGADPESKDDKQRRPVDVVKPKGGYVYNLLASKSKVTQPQLF